MQNRERAREREKRQRQRDRKKKDWEASSLQASSLITQVSNSVHYNTQNSQIFNKNTVGTWPPTLIGALCVSGFPETGIVKPGYI